MDAFSVIVLPLLYHRSVQNHSANDNVGTSNLREFAPALLEVDLSGRDGSLL